MIKRNENTVRPQCRKQCKTLYNTDNSRMYDLQASQEVFEIVPIGMDASIYATWTDVHFRRFRLLRWSQPQRWRFVTQDPFYNLRECTMLSWRPSENNQDEINQMIWGGGCHGTATLNLIVSKWSFTVLA